MAWSHPPPTCSTPLHGGNPTSHRVSWHVVCLVELGCLLVTLCMDFCYLARLGIGPLGTTKVGELTSDPNGSLGGLCSFDQWTSLNRTAKALSPSLSVNILSLSSPLPWVPLLSPQSSPFLAPTFLSLSLSLCPVWASPLCPTLHLVLPLSTNFAQSLRSSTGASPAVPASFLTFL